MTNLVAYWKLLVGSSIITHSINTQESMVVGNVLDNNSYKLDGRVDKVVVWRRALALTKIQILYNEGAGSNHENWK